MATSVYRFKDNHIRIDTVTNETGGPPLILSGVSPGYVDITADTTQLSDLQDAMGRRGHVLNATNPSNSAVDQVISDLGVSSNPRRILWRDHFVTGNGDTDETGLMGWRQTTAGTGAAVNPVTGLSGRQGILRLEGGTTAAARCSIYLGDSSLANSVFVNATQNQIDFGWVVAPQTTISIVDLERLQVGLGSEWTMDAELLNGLYWRYTPGTDTNWTFVSANGGSRTIRASSTAPVSGTFVKLEATITYPGGVPTVQAKLNGSNVGSVITTDIPSAVSPGAMVQSVGAVVLEPMLDIDETWGYQDPIS